MARTGDPLHVAGCMLYWAEGAKDKNRVRFTNSEVPMVAAFVQFIRLFFDVPDERFALSLNVYTTNGLSLTQIERHWLEALDLPRSCLRAHTLDHTPTSSSGIKHNKLPHGVALLAVLKSTPVVQHIYGAIQEYGGFEEPRWLG
jgi:hypothetical protein